MRVGILTMQRIINYGSFLQSFALFHTIEKLGHEPCFIDIRKGEKWSVEQNPNNSIGFILDRLDRYFFKRINHYFFIRKRAKLFTEQLFPQIGIDIPRNENECDVVIIGSDEVFNYQPKSPWGFSTQLYGDVDCRKVISYAGSFANTSIGYLQENGVMEEVKKALGKISNLSVRDRDSATCVEQLLGITPQIHLDPVFIYNFEKNIPQIHSLDNYILVYSYDNRIRDPNEIIAIKAFARKEKKKLISFGLFQKWCDRNILVTPFELLGYFMKADYVITDTFHGTVFSIKSNKKFVSIVRESNSSKLNDLLNTFNLRERRLRDLAQLEQTLKKEIDYSIINQLISIEIDRSLEYLSKSL